MIPPHGACLRAWPAVAARLGVNPEQAPERLRADGSVLRFGDVVLKHAPQNFPRVVRAHRQAARLLKGSKRHRAVPFLGFDQAHQVVVLAFVPGAPLASLAQAGADPIQLCTQIGEWLGQYHRARPQHIARFDAWGPVRRIPEQAAFLPKAYDAARARLMGQAADLHKTPQMHAVLHGDLNGANLIICGPRVTGLDFENLHAHPALRDAGQVLAALHLCAAQPPDQVLPAAWRDAFTRGYGVCSGVLDFFVLQRLLLHWAGVPATRRFLAPNRHHMARTLAALFAC